MVLYFPITTKIKEHTRIIYGQRSAFMN